MNETTSYRTTILSRIWLSDNVFALHCIRPPAYSFRAGQHAALRYQGEERDYSMISAPGSAELRFLIKVVAHGILSPVLAALEPGSALDLGPAKGYLRFQPSDRPAFFVASGVGIAPFVAMVADGVHNFYMLHGARYATELFFREKLHKAAQQYVPCLSRESAAQNAAAGGFQGYVTHYVEEQLSDGIYDFYLCGSRAMVHDMTHLLDRKFSQSRIYSESFD